MPLVTGPPGSGKTTLVLDRARAALASSDAAFRLLVPTATMAEHIRNRLAREGLAFRPALVLTLWKFVEDCVPEPPQVSPAILRLVVEQALERRSPAAFRDVAAFAGFRDALTGLVNEFSLAGCDAARTGGLLRKHGLEAPYGAAVTSLYGDVEAELRRRGLVLRAEKLRAAARAVERGAAGASFFLLDGFTSLSDLELSLLGALSRSGEVIVTMPLSPGSESTREKLLAMGFAEHKCERLRARPRELLFVAPTIAQEAGEIARRILEQRASGRPFREMGVILRSEKPCAPALRSVFDRFGIPARFYFSAPLDSHPAVAFLAGIVESLLNGWNHETVLDALRACMAGDQDFDRFDFAVRLGLPGQGLESLCAHAAGPRLPELIEQCAKIEPWRASKETAAAWSARVASLAGLFVPSGTHGPLTPERAEVWRSQAWALRQFRAAMDEAAEAFDGDASVSLAEFWAAAKAVLQLSSLRVPDHRRDVVHVMDVLESRQWELPVVFVCGLLEKRFPQYHSQNPLLADDARRRLNRDGLRLRTSLDAQKEERFFFDVAASRATELLVFSYPRFNAKGDENLPSFFLDGRQAAAENLVRARPRPLWPHQAPPRPALASPGVLAEVAARRRRFSATSVESFLRCPFQFFAGQTLRLGPPPPRPEDRLDAFLKGSVVHAAIQSWHASGGDIAALVDEALDQAVEEHRAPKGYRTEFERLAMRRVLLRFAADPHLVSGWAPGYERKFELELRDDVRVAGRIDRCEVGPDGGAVVIDYKYAGPDRLKELIKGHEEGKIIQVSLYLLALVRLFGLRPAGMCYWALKVKDKPRYGWHTGVLDLDAGEELTPQALNEMLQQAEQRILAAVDAVRAGRIEATPEEKTCQYCDYFDICRTRLTAAREAAAGGEE